MVIVTNIIFTFIIKMAVLTVILLLCNYSYKKYTFFLSIREKLKYSV